MSKIQIFPTATVRARGRRYVVMGVTEHRECRTVRLAPVEPGGVPISLLHPYDAVQVVAISGTPKRAGRQRVARACAAAVRASYAAGETRSAVDAAIRVLPYQLEPALAVVRGETTRVLLADEVGLGKTIQAGLILSELRARQLLGRALVLTPAGLREQWAAELRERFSFDVSVIDAGELAAYQRTLPPWVNAWTLPGVALASIDLLKRSELLPQLEHVIWDAVVVDEAHHATGGTDRHAAASLTCSRARVVVLMTATPHSGERSAFEDLCSLGALASDPPIRIFRRRRDDVQAGALARRVRLMFVRRSPAERRLDAALGEYTMRVWREASHEDSARNEARLAMVVLRKRALSGPASLARSLAKRLAALDGSNAWTAGAQLSLDFSDAIGGELTDEDSEPARDLQAPGLADGRAERSILSDLLERARATVHEDSKAARLIAAITAAREPAIVFTEYRDTLEDLRRRLEGSTPVAVIHGGMLPLERMRALAAFDEGRVRVLLATDAAAEGLNLHRRCRWVIHHEVPWSPVRIEQRNGRVDRLGQSRRVHVWHFIAAGTEEEAVLARLARRSAVAARDLADPDVVVHAVFDAASLPVDGGSRPRGALDAAAAIEAARVSLLRRLAGGSQPVPRPLCERGIRPGHRSIAVFKVVVFDPRARLIAADCFAISGRSLEACHRRARREAGRRARRSIAIDRARSHAAAEREEALGAALRSATDGPVQASLFDRRALADSDHRRSELRRALSELWQCSRMREPYTVRTSLLGILAA